MPEVTPSDWESFLSNYPDVHLLQTSAWGELKSDFGWEAVYIRVEEEKFTSGSLGTLLLLRRLPLGLSLAYIPKGPVGMESTDEATPAWDSLWSEVDALCRRRKSVFLKVEPDLWEASQKSDLPEGSPVIRPGAPVRFPSAGFRLSQQDIQPSRTLVIDLGGSEEDVLSRMKQKTRYNIRLALKKGVIAYQSPDIETFHHLLRITGDRDNFGVHSLDYYRRAYQLFQPQGECALLMAAFQEKPIAAIMVFAHGKRAWYFYGASSDEHRELMPTYLLQWEAIRWARHRGCNTYDLWGVPDADESILEADFLQRSEGLWGVYRFKRGFGGELRRSIGSWDRIYYPLIYAFYRWWVGKRTGDQVQ